MQTHQLHTEYAYQVCICQVVFLTLANWFQETNHKSSQNTCLGCRDLVKQQFPKVFAHRSLRAIIKNDLRNTCLTANSCERRSIRSDLETLGSRVWKDPTCGDHPPSGIFQQRMTRCPKMFDVATLTILRNRVNGYMGGHISPRAGS